MDGHIAQIHQYPLRGLSPFDTQGPHAHLPDAFQNGIDQCPDMTAGCAAGNDHEISEVCDLTHVQDLNVLGLEILKDTDHVIAQDRGGDGEFGATLHAYGTLPQRLRFELASRHPGPAPYRPWRRM